MTSNEEKVRALLNSHLDRETAEMFLNKKHRDFGEFTPEEFVKQLLKTGAVKDENTGWLTVLGIFMRMFR